MYLSFHSIEIRDICEKEELALSLYDEGIVDILKSRLSELQSLDSIDNYLFLGTINNEKYFVRLSNHLILVLELIEVNRIKILDIEKNEF